AGFLFGGQGLKQAVVAEGMVQDVDVDGQHVVVRQPDEPVEGDAGVGVLGHLVELVGLAAARGDDLHDDLEVERGQWPQVVGGAVEQGGVRAADGNSRYLPQQDVEVAA